MKTKTEQALELMAKAAELLKEEEASPNPRVEEWPKMGDSYHGLSRNGVHCYTYENDDIDKEITERGLAFRTEQEAKLADQARIAITTIKNYARQQWGEFKPDWGNSSKKKYYIAWNYELGKPDVDYSNYWCKFSPIGYFREREHAEEIITKFSEELDVIRKFYT